MCHWIVTRLSKVPTCHPLSSMHRINENKSIIQLINQSIKLSRHFAIKYRPLTIFLCASKRSLSKKKKKKVLTTLLQNVVKYVTECFPEFIDGSFLKGISYIAITKF